MDEETSAKLDILTILLKDSGFSDVSSPVSSISSRMMDSPMSQSGEQPMQNFQFYSQFSSDPSSFGNSNLEFQTRSNIYPAANAVPGQKPYLEIIEQPVDKFRFRYKSEMHGTHGSLMGANSGKSKKTFPTVELRNYNGKAVIRCSLYQTDTTLKQSPHSHKLVVRNGDQDICDPHELYVSHGDGYRAVFMGMGIIHTAKKHIVEELIYKKLKEKKFELNRPLSKREEYTIKTSAEQEAKSMNLNQVRLAFHAYAVNEDQSWSELCDPIFSRPINNMKSALTGELKITRLSAAVSTAAGGDDLFLFVEKVGKKNIKVRFFEVDENDDEVWQDFGIFSEADVHHQYAIALKTPPYKDRDIDHYVDVYIQLIRPSDNDRSERLPFKYKPRDFVSSRKRPRTSSSSNFSSSDLPQTINTGKILNSSSSSFSNISLNKSDLMKELFDFEKQVKMDSDKLMSYIGKDLLDITKFDPLEQAELQKDGVSSAHPISTRAPSNPFMNPKRLLQQNPSTSSFRESCTENSLYSSYIKRILSTIRTSTNVNDNIRKISILKIFSEANSQNDDILHNALSSGDNGTIVKLLHLIYKFDLNEVLQYQNEQSETVLHIACLYDKSEFIKPLINLGANPNIQNYKGDTALHIAVENNFIQCVSKIIEKVNYTKKSVPLQINLTNDEGLTPLHLAVKQKNLPIVKKLIEIGEASVKMCITTNGNSILHAAVERKNKDIVKYLLERTSVDINQLNTSGFSPLQLAQISNDAEITELLLNHGADPLSSLESNKEDSIKSSTTDEGSSSTDDDDYDEKPLVLIDEFETCTIEEDDETKIDTNNTTTRLSNLLRGERLRMLAALFDKNDNWREIAYLLKHDHMTCVWQNENSPSTAMFIYIANHNDQFSYEQILETFVKLKNTKAVRILQNLEN